LNNENQPFNKVLVKLFTRNPLDSVGNLKADYMDYLIFKGNTNENGELNCRISPATTVDSLSVLVEHIGLPTLQTVKLVGTNVNIRIGGQTQAVKQASKIGLYKVVTPQTPNASGFYVLGDWNSLGVPNYLSANDVISNSLLADINASLPEYKPLTTTHPQYLEDTNDGSVKLYEDAEVWVTFVHEGAGWSNALAYYTYPNGNPPATADAITDKTIIFPNFSFVNLGGGLVSGNKVQLQYLDPVTKQYTTRFPKGTTVAWILRAQGWSSSSHQVVAGLCTHYSDSRFNSESDSKLKKHNVVLNDAARKLLLIGFEDMRRDNGADNDFNDAVYYASVNPYTAIDEKQYKVIDKPVDTDGDGVTDVNDEYPNDPTRAYNNYYPAKGQTGTLAFEDLWPSKGDYDFNDMIVDYNYNQITNGANQVVAFNAELSLRAKGAHYTNAFGIQFNTNPENVKSITGQHITNGYLNIGSNGTENNQSKAVVIVYDNAYDLLKTYNTIIGQTYYTPKTIKLNIEFSSPIDPIVFGTAPYNPFIIIDKNRGKEVHLPTLPPTDLADKNLLGTKDDNSNIALGKYYMSDKYLPWAINIPITFDYPAENEDITKAFLNFNKWAESNGATNTDWYVNKAGYRDNSKIFIK
jgi:LruC domain-containing protein